MAILALNVDAVKLSSGALPDYDRDNPNVQEAIRFWNENFGDEYYVTCTTLKEKLEDDDEATDVLGDLLCSSLFTLARDGGLGEGDDLDVRGDGAER